MTEFAEQVVFGTTLADKLADPGPLTSFSDNASSLTVTSLATPGRPRGLRMQYATGAAPPSDTKLENEKARGQLLHFLANHELLATELMALVLLKFPDAPPAFRQGVLVTLREEQEHTRLYLQRMKECGVEFGSYPVSGHFWRVVEPMESPMDFVSRLSLTFEQANLDYSRHFANVFQQVGDVQTAAILERIYQDEIGHVRHGLHWFRQWKEPDQSDWDAYRSRLTFPMSPERARGPKGFFNREGRVAAGLSDEFIDTVEVFRQSRGRPPTVRWFDPAVEAELAQELRPREQRLMHQLCVDLEGVMISLSKQDDVMLTLRIPSQPFRKQLLDAGFDLPEFIRLADRQDLGERKLSDLQPWAWSPRNHRLALPLTPAVREPPPAWREEHLDLFRKSWGANRLRDWLKDEPHPLFITADCVGVRVKCTEEVQSAMDHFAKSSHKSVLFKQDLATSGRGQRRLVTGRQLSERDKTWLESAFISGRVGVVEPELDRVLDLSFLWHFARGAESPAFLGWTRPLVTPGRHYAGTRIGRPISGWDKSLTRFLLADRGKLIHDVKDWLSTRIATELTRRNFRGSFGVDALICKQSAVAGSNHGDFRIKPLVELNPRTTMGHIALRIEQRLAPGVQGELRVLSRGEWETIHNQLADVPLLKLRDGRWKSGVVWLGEVHEQTRLVPVVLIGDQMIELGAGGARECRSMARADKDAIDSNADITASNRIGGDQALL